MCVSSGTAPILVHPGTRFASLQALAVEVPSVSVAPEFANANETLPAHVLHTFPASLSPMISPLQVFCTCVVGVFECISVFFREFQCACLLMASTNLLKFNDCLLAFMQYLSISIMNHAEYCGSANVNALHACRLLLCGICTFCATCSEIRVCFCHQIHATRNDHLFVEHIFRR